MKASEDQTFLLVDPAKLSVHPAVEIVPGMSDESRAVLEKNVQECGKIHQALICHKTADGKLLVVDGRNRLSAALSANLRTVPVIIDNSSNPLMTAIDSAIARRQLTKSGVALTLFEAHPDLRKERDVRRQANLLKRKPKKEIDDSVAEQKLNLPSFAVMAERYGIPSEYFSKLALMWDSATGPEGEKKWQEVRAKILSGDAGIPKLLEGFKSWLVTGKANRPLDRKRDPVDHHQLAHQAIKEFPLRLARVWLKMGPKERLELINKFEPEADKIPIDLAEQLGDMLSRSGAKRR